MAAPGTTVENVPDADAHADYAGAARRDRAWRTSKGVAAYVVLTIFALIATVPFIYLLSPSLRQSYELFTYPPQWIPETVYWGNFGTVLHDTSYLRWGLEHADLRDVGDRDHARDRHARRATPSPG